MASTLFPVTSTATGIRSSSGHRKSDMHRVNSQSSNWWTPLFGMSASPDYLQGDNPAGKSASPPSSSDVVVVDLEVSSSSSSRSKFVPGGFTEEKAKQLRARTVETVNFHDKMYHSAIASRLASDRRNN